MSCEGSQPRGRGKEQKGMKMKGFVKVRAKRVTEENFTYWKKEMSLLKLM